MVWEELQAYGNKIVDVTNDILMELVPKQEYAVIIVFLFSLLISIIIKRAKFERDKPWMYIILTILIYGTLRWLGIGG